ncbi:MAG: Hsp20/alpha crystallin family protein [Akkermansiaceae bacterium]|nr:Hsp20/alpha crystallin family protein [Akkermansiaceae bacterium]
MITHYPFNNGVFNELNRFVSQALEADHVNRCNGGQCTAPASQDIESIQNDTDGWKIRLELPGYTKEEVKLSVDQRFLTITAETDDEERRFLGKEQRRVRISDDVDADNIKARLENGILYLEIPHRVKAEPKSIVVN